MHVMDIARNSVEARAANVKVSFMLNKPDGQLIVTIQDDGCGMDADMVNKVTDPFTTTRTTRKVGMGLPLIKMSAEQTGGALTITSEQGRGTMVTSVFNTKHIDCVPMGDLAGTATLLITGNRDVLFEFEFCTGNNKYNITTGEICKALGESDINQPKVIRFIKEMIAENIKKTGFEF